MNTQLVDYLVGVITHLNPEEKTLLQEKLAIEKISQDTQQNYQELIQLRASIFHRRQGKPLIPNPDDIIYQLRSERDEQLMSVGFGDLFNHNNS